MLVLDLIDVRGAPAGVVNEVMLAIETAASMSGDLDGSRAIASTAEMLDWQDPPSTSPFAHASTGSQAMADTSLLRKMAEVDVAGHHRVGDETNAKAALRHKHI